LDVVGVVRAVGVAGRTLQVARLDNLDERNAGGGAFDKVGVVPCGLGRRGTARPAAAAPAAGADRVVVEPPVRVDQNVERAVLGAALGEVDPPVALVDLGVDLPKAVRTEARRALDRAS